MEEISVNFQQRPIRCISNQRKNPCNDFEDLPLILFTKQDN